MTMSGNPYRIEYDPKVVRKDIPKLSQAIQRRVRDAIENKLTHDPLRFGEALRYSLSGFRRLRVGDYRVVYKVEEQDLRVYIAMICHRKDVYED